MLKIEGLSLYENDKDLESMEGVDISITPTMSIRILRAGGTNKKYTRAFLRVTKPYERQMKANVLDDDLGVELYAKIYAESVVIGWKGVVEEDTHEPLEFTKENVESLLISYPEILRYLIEKAESLDTFRREEMQEVAEELGNSSAGS